MFDQSSRAKEYLHMILNIAISSLFATLEQLLSNIQGTLIWDLVFIPCGILFALIYITKYFHWNKGDLSSFFFWALIVKRMFLFGINEREFVYFLFGLLNGIYTNKLYINDSKKFYLKSKTIIQVIVILGLIIVNLMNQKRENKIALITIFIIVSIILGINDNIEMQNQTKKQDDYQTDLKHNQFELKKCQTTIVQIQQQQLQQYQQKSNWEQYQQQTDEWICKMDVNKYSLTESINSSEQNYAMKKSLGDYKISISQLFQNLMITSQTTNLQQSINLLSEIVETNSLFSWLEKNFFSESSAGKLEQAKQKQYKYGFDGIQGIQEDQMSIISPQNEGRCTINKDQVYELSALSAFQQHGDMQGSNSVLSNKTTLGCYLVINQTRLEMSVSIYVMEDEFDSKKAILVLVIRNIEKETKKLKISLENTEQQRVIFYKYIQRVADDVCQILQQIVQIKKQLDQRQKEFDKIKQTNFISLSFCDGDAFIKSEKMIGDMKLSQHLSVPMQSVVQNQNQRVTSSLTQNPDSQEEQLQKLYTFSQPAELIKQIDKCQYNVVLIEQNNFNFFELFSISEYKTNRFNFIKSLNIVKDLFKFDSCIQKYNITISYELQNENEMELTTDKRRVKQVLINLIKNSIQCFDYNLQKGQDEKLTLMSTEQKQDIKVQNTIIIKAWADEDKINVEIIDNGGGIKKEMIKNRIQDCKLGLLACQKILRNLSYDLQKPLEIINYMKTKDGIKGTTVSFTLSKQFIPTQWNEENIFTDSLTIINKVELN
ncbi:unnamed protein product [Paramecium sonneborni]|uniref:Histidine kinase/HSP90-like ATPase domain-containing protein n=1 Tax=Paramecium sonneborni TaxID=65129 RepID=A0A8S1KHQ8_9CILI|nr:unnamed protein product [Paramecium sonneborni]